MSDRILKISEEIKRELASIIQSQLKDPRISGIISVVNVNVTKDLKYAKVYISVLGTPEDKTNSIKGLKSAAGFIRKEIGSRIQLRYVPELNFVIDDSIEKGVYLTKLIEEVSQKSDRQGNDEDANE